MKRFQRSPAFAIHTAAFCCIAICVSTAYAAAQPLDSLERDRKARELFINGTTLQIQGNRHAEAILEFQQALRYDSSAVTLAAIARSYFELRKLDLALEYADAAVQRDSTSRDIWELIAEIEVLRGRYDEGIAAYERILTLNPTRRQLYTLGRLYEPRNAAKAIEMFERLSASQPDPTLLLRLADLYERRRDMKGVLRSLDRARTADPFDPQIAARSCEAFVREAMFPELNVVLSQWKRSDPELERSARIWGVTFTSLLEDSLVMALHADAITPLLDDALATFADVWPVMALAGTVSVALDDTTRSRSLFDQTILASNHRVESYLEVGRIYILRSYPALAVDYLLEGLRRYPSDARFAFMLGGASIELDRDDDAISYYTAAVELDPRMVDAWVQLAILYDQRGMADSSDALYRRALRLEPDNALALNNLGYSLSQRNIRLDEARAMAWRAVQSEPQNPAYLDTYAWVLYKLGEYQEARFYIERAISVGGNATHYEHLGDILLALQEHAPAVSAWRQALARDPSRIRIQQKIDQLK
jgi:tetratricopeptide (TPR) repeat protein